MQNYTNVTVVFADVAQNWWVVATIVAVVALFLSLMSKLYLRNGLINLFVGIPAGIWMLATQAGVTMGGSIPLYLSIALCVGHIGVAASNFLATVLVEAEKK